MNKLRIGFYEHATPARDEAAGKAVPTVLHLVWKAAETNPIDWALKVSSIADSKPDASSAKITSDPSFLYVSGSRSVKFTSSDSAIPLGCFVSATFENASLYPPKTTSPPASNSPQAHNSISLMIPQSMTDRPGYKEIVIAYHPFDQSSTTLCSKSVTKSPSTGIIVVGGTNDRK